MKMRQRRWWPLTGAAGAPWPQKAREGHLGRATELSSTVDSVSFAVQSATSSAGAPNIRRCVHEFHLGAWKEPHSHARFCVTADLCLLLQDIAGFGAGEESFGNRSWRVRSQIAASGGVGSVSEEMQGVLSMVASGQAVAGSLVLGSPSVATGQHSHGVLAVSRKPFGATLDIANSRSVALSRFDSRHSFPLGKRLRDRSCLRLSALQQSTSAKSVKWVLDPVGDGNSSHLDSPVPLPSGFELASDAVTVGRVKERVDVVIPVATVSGVHARLEKRDGQLFVTDLDSTNGTFVNDKRIRPGAVTSVPTGSYITFGDEHLAVFKFLQFEEPGEAPTEAPVAVPEESQA